MQVHTIANIKTTLGLQDVHVNWRGSRTLQHMLAAGWRITEFDAHPAHLAFTMAYATANDHVMCLLLCDAVDTWPARHRKHDETKLIQAIQRLAQPAAYAASLGSTAAQDPGITCVLLPAAFEPKLVRFIASSTARLAHADGTQTYVPASAKLSAGSPPGLMLMDAAGHCMWWRWDVERRAWEYVGLLSEIAPRVLAADTEADIVAAAGQPADGLTPQPDASIPPVVLHAHVGAAGTIAAVVQEGAEKKLFVWQRQPLQLPPGAPVATGFANPSKRVERLAALDHVQVQLLATKSVAPELRGLPGPVRSCTGGVPAEPSAGIAVWSWEQDSVMLSVLPARSMARAWAAAESSDITVYEAQAAARIGSVLAACQSPSPAALVHCADGSWWHIALGMPFLADLLQPAQQGIRRKAAKPELRWTCLRQAHPASTAPAWITACLAPAGEYVAAVCAEDEQAALQLLHVPSGQLVHSTAIGANSVQALQLKLRWPDAWYATLHPMLFASSSQALVGYPACVAPFSLADDTCPEQQWGQFAAAAAKHMLTAALMGTEQEPLAIHPLDEALADPADERAGLIDTAGTRALRALGLLQIAQPGCDWARALAVAIRQQSKAAVPDSRALLLACEQLHRIAARDGTQSATTRAFLACAGQSDSAAPVSATTLARCEAWACALPEPTARAAIWLLQNPVLQEHDAQLWQRADATEVRAALRSWCARGTAWLPQGSGDAAGSPALLDALTAIRSAITACSSFSDVRALVQALLSCRCSGSSSSGSSRASVEGGEADQAYDRPPTALQAARDMLASLRAPQHLTPLKVRAASTGMPITAGGSTASPWLTLPTPGGPGISPGHIDAVKSPIPSKLSAAWADSDPRAASVPVPAPRSPASSTGSARSFSQPVPSASMAQPAKDYLAKLARAATGRGIERACMQLVRVHKRAVVHTAKASLACRVACALYQGSFGLKPGGWCTCSHQDHDSEGEFGPSSLAPEHARQVLANAFRPLLTVALRKCNLRAVHVLIHAMPEQWTAAQVIDSLTCAAKVSPTDTAPLVRYGKPWNADKPAGYPDDGPLAIAQVMSTEVDLQAWLGGSWQGLPALCVLAILRGLYRQHGPSGAPSTHGTSLKPVPEVYSVSDLLALEAGSSAQPHQHQQAAPSPRFPRASSMGSSMFDSADDDDILVGV